MHNLLQCLTTQLAHRVIFAAARQAGLKVMLRTGDYIPRAGGTIWCSADFVQKNPETVKKMARAIAKAVMDLRADRQGSIAVLRHHIGSVKSDEQAGLIWDEVHNTFGAELPPTCSVKSLNRAG